MTTITITGVTTIETITTTMCMTGKKTVLTVAICGNNTMNILAWADRGVNGRGNTGDGVIYILVWL